MSATRRVLGWLACAALAGCGSSPPSHFFALNPVSPDRHPPAVTALPLKIDAVHIPPLLDRESMVRGEERNQLAVSSQDRWGADFGEMVRSVLTRDLTSRLPPGTVIPPDMPAPDSARGLVVDILSFVPDPSGRVVLDADWTVLQNAPAQPMLPRSVHLSAAAGATAHDQAAAMSGLLARLADEIAAGVAAGVASSAP